MQAHKVGLYDLFLRLFDFAAAIAQVLMEEKERQRQQRVAENRERHRKKRLQ